MTDLKLLKSMIRQGKEKDAVPSKDPETQPQEEQQQQQDDVVHCPIHDCDMPRRWSKRTNSTYFSHRLPDGRPCYGRERK